MAELVSLGVRTLHVLSAVVIVGGAAAVGHRYRTAPAPDLGFAVRYEWAFWTGFGLLVLTGVGNLGAVGPPGPGTPWGVTLLAKLLLVVGVACLSIVRTVVVARARDRDAAGESAGLERTLGRVYGATTAGLLLIVVLAEVLAHG